MKNTLLFVLFLAACSSKANAPVALSAPAKVVFSASRNAATLSSGTIDPIGQSSTGKLVPANNVPADILASGIDAVKIANGSVSSAEFQTLDGSNTSTTIQAQLDGKQGALTLPLSTANGGFGQNVSTGLTNNQLLRTSAGTISFSASPTITSLTATTALNANVLDGTVQSPFGLTLKSNLSATPGVIFANTSSITASNVFVSFTTNGTQRAAILGNGGLLGPTIGPNGTQQHTLPAVTSDTVTLNAAAQTLTNKTLSAPGLSGTLTGTYTLGGTPTISSDLNPSTNGARSLGSSSFQFGNVWTRNVQAGTNTLSLGSQVTNGATARAVVISSDTTFSTTGATLLSLHNNNITTPVAAFHYDGNLIAPGAGTSTSTFHAFPTTGTGAYVTTDSTSTLTNKTYSAPVFSGTSTGTWTITGTPTLDRGLAVGTADTWSIGSSANRLSQVFTTIVNSGTSGTLSLFTEKPDTAGNVAVQIGVVNTPAWSIDGQKLLKLSNGSERFFVTTEGLLGLRVGSSESATTITPIRSVEHITGTPAIVTINPPAACTTGQMSCKISLIADGAFTWTAAGNISVAGTAVTGMTYEFIYDPTPAKWYPVQ